MSLTPCKKIMYLVLLFLAMPILAWAGDHAKPSDSKAQLSKKQLEVLANSGDREAQFRLGRYFESIETTPDNDRLSVYWYSQAANQEHVLAQYNLGVKFMVGQGVSKDPEKALSWWLKSANSGHVYSQFNVGRAYFLGVGLPQDHSKAKFWLQEAAQQNDPKAVEILTKLGWNESSQINNNRDQASNDSNKDAKELFKSEKSREKSSYTPDEVTRVKKTQNAIAIKSDINSAINLYTGPNSHNHFMYQLPNRKGLSIIATRGQNWLKISNSSNFPVWVHQQFVQINQSNQKETVITASGVRARGVPQATVGTVLGFFKQGETVAILEKQGEWYRVIPASTSFNVWVKRKEWVSH